MSTRSLLLGLGAQVMWTAIGYVLFTFAWRAAIALSAAPRANIKKHLPLVRRALAERGLIDKSMILMALAMFLRCLLRLSGPIADSPSDSGSDSSQRHVSF